MKGANERNKEDRKEETNSGDKEGKSTVKVKCSLLQALSRCTAHRGSRGIALLFLDHGTRRGEGSVSRPGRSLRPGKTRYSLNRRRGGPRAGLDRCGKSRPHRDSIPGPSSP